MVLTGQLWQPWADGTPSRRLEAGSVMPGPLMIIGGAEDKLRRRRILKEFVAAAGGLDARIAVIPTASSLGPEIVDVYEALFRAEGAAEVVEVRPQSREEAQDPELVKRIDEATGIFMTGGNQLKLSSVDLRDAGRRRHRGRPPAGRRRGRHVRRRQHPVQPHGRVRRRRRHAQAADDPGRRRAGAARVDRDRPALRPAQPLRSLVDDRLPVTVTARARCRRGHRRRRGDRRRTATSCCGSSAAARSRSWTRPRW